MRKLFRYLAPAGLAALSGMAPLSAAHAGSALTLAAAAETTKAGPDVSLHWNALPSSAEYYIFRDFRNQTAPVTKTAYVDAQVAAGQTHNYFIVSANSKGQFMAMSNIVTVKVIGSAPAPVPPPVPVPAPPAAPTGLTATPQWEASCPKCGGMAMAHIALSWTGVKGASSYDLYRNGVLFQHSLTGTADTDMAVTSGQTYAYNVTAVGVGGESAKSSTATATAPSPPMVGDGDALTAPVNLTVQGLWNGGAGDMLNWDPVPGAVSYNVYQYDSAVVKGVTGTSALIPPCLFNGSMTYSVTAVDAMGMESLPSAIAGAQGAWNPSQQPGWTPEAPTTPIKLTTTPEWNAGAPRIHLVWQETSNANCHGTDATYNVYRDGQKVAVGLWGLNYFDTRVMPGETHTYTVTGVNTPWTTPMESPQSASVTAMALEAAPMASLSKVEVTGVKAGNNSALVSFAAVPGAMDYRIYDASNPNSVKYSGGGLSIQMNGLNPGTTPRLVIEALDKLGPFQTSDGEMGPGAMDMSGTIHSGVNGQGDPSNQPIVIAKSDPVSVALQPERLTGSQAFFDNFVDEQPLVTSALNPAVAALSNTYSEVTGVENDKWRIVNYGEDSAMSRMFFMGNHFMDTIYDGPTAATAPFSHNNNASMVLSPKATADISGGKVLHVTFEVDAHFDSRRWCDLFIGKPGDPIVHPGKFAQTDGGNNYATVGGDLFRWEIRSGAHGAQVFHAGTETDLMQCTDWNDGQTVARSTWDGKPLTEGTAQEIDKRNRFDLYLSKTRFRTVETAADGTHTIIRDKQFPAGTTLPFDKCQVYFVHQLYHTGNDRPEQLIWSGGTGSYWYNYRPYSDERHWDNMGFEVLSAFPK